MRVWCHITVSQDEGPGDLLRAQAPLQWDRYQCNRCFRQHTHTHAHIHTHTHNHYAIHGSISLHCFVLAGWTHTHKLPPICFSLLYSASRSDRQTTTNKKRNLSSHSPQILLFFLALFAICPFHPFFRSSNHPFILWLSLTHTSTLNAAPHTPQWDKISCEKWNTHHLAQMHLLWILHNRWLLTGITDRNTIMIKDCSPLPILCSLAITRVMQRNTNKSYFPTRRQRHHIIYLI